MERPQPKTRAGRRESLTRIYPSGGICDRDLLQARLVRPVASARCKHISEYLGQRGGYGLFSPGEGLAKSRLTAIGGIWMNDSALGGFVDCRDQRADLIRARRLRGTHRLLHAPHMRHNAPIAKRSLHRLPSAFSS